MPLQIGEFDPPVLFEVTTAHDAPEVDLSVLLLDEHGHTRTDRDFVFYNAPTSPFGAVRLTPPEGDRNDVKRAVLVDIGALRHEGVERLAVIVSSDAPLLDHRPGLRVALVAGQSQSRDLPLPEEPGLTAGVVAELYLRRSRNGSCAATRSTRRPSTPAATVPAPAGSSGSLCDLRR